MQEGTVFSHVHLSFYLSGGPHVTITHTHLDIRLADPHPLNIRHGTLLLAPAPSWTSDLGPPTSPRNDLLTSGCQHWRPVQTCSLEALRSDIWVWPLKHVWYASERYASYWNAFLYFPIFRDVHCNMKKSIHAFIYIKSIHSSTVSLPIPKEFV